MISVFGLHPQLVVFVGRVVDGHVCGRERDPDPCCGRVAQEHLDALGLEIVDQFFPLGLFGLAVVCAKRNSLGLQIRLDLVDFLNAHGPDDDGALLVFLQQTLQKISKHGESRVVFGRQDHRLTIDVDIAGRNLLELRTRCRSIERYIKHEIFVLENKVVVFFHALVNLSLLRRHFEVYALVHLVRQEWQCFLLRDPEAVRLDQGSQLVQVPEYRAPIIVFFDELRRHGLLPFQLAHDSDHSRIVTGHQDGKFGHKRPIGFSPQNSIPQELELHEQIGRCPRQRSSGKDATGHGLLAQLYYLFRTLGLWVFDPR